MNTKELKGLLRTQLAEATARTSEIKANYDKKLYACGVENLTTQVVSAEVKDDKLYEYMWTDKGAVFNFLGLTVFDKESQSILTLVVEGGDKKKYRVSEIGSDMWTVNKRYVDDSENVIQSFFYPQDKRMFHVAAYKKRVEENKAKREARSNKTFAQLEPITEDMVRWAREDIMGKYNTLIYDAKTRKAVCGRCESEMKLPKIHPHYGEVAKCPVCGKDVTYRSKGKMGTGYYNEEEVTFVQHLGDNVVVRYFTAGLSSCRDGSNRFDFCETAREIVDFEAENVGIYKPVGNVWNKVTVKYISYGWFGFSKPWIQTWGNNGYTYQPSLREVIDSTPLKYSGVDKYADFSGLHDTSDFTHYLRIWLKNQRLEWIVKCGFKKVVDEIMNSDKLVSYYPMKSKGKNLADVFHLTKQQYKAILPYAETISYKEIVFCFMHPEQKVESVLEFSKAVPSASTSDFNSILELTTLHKAARYLEKNSLYSWMDYIRMSKEDGTFDKNNSMILFPRHLNAAHQQQIEIRREAHKKAELQKYQPMLNKIAEIADKMHSQFDFKQGNLLMTVPETGDEIIEEGRTQHICVGSLSMPYISNMANGIGFILFVRDEAHPAEPFYTVEVRDGQIVQVRGKYNSAPTEDVEKFIDAFAQAKQLVCKY